MCVLGYCSHIYFFISPTLSASGRFYFVNVALGIFTYIFIILSFAAFYNKQWAVAEFHFGIIIVFSDKKKSGNVKILQVSRNKQRISQFKIFAARYRLNLGRAFTTHLLNQW